MTQIAADMQDLRRQVRADRHATSIPLVVVGAVGFHYVSVGLFSAPVPWVYGLPLAFIAVWALQWRTEQTRGIAAGRDDPLLVAFAVFVAISLFASESWQQLMGPLDFIWRENSGEDFAQSAFALAATTLGMAYLGRRQENRALVRWGLLLTVGVAAGWGLKDSYLQASEVYAPYQQLVWQATFLGATIAGLISYRREGVDGAS